MKFRFPMPAGTYIQIMSPSLQPFGTGAGTTIRGFGKTDTEDDYPIYLKDLLVGDSHFEQTDVNVNFRAKSKRANLERHPVQWRLCCI